jgi:predicted lipoprotein with Yx(FWY)xxD motif
VRPTFLLTLAAVAAALVLAACGGGSTSKTSSGAAATSDTVSVKHVNGLGAVLVDASGKALYSPAQDTATMIRCTGQCTTFWQPLVAGAGKPSAGSGVPTLGVIKRPDGMRQVTAAGKPLYTFSEDSAGKINGNGFMDKFGGRAFQWHLVLAGGGTAPKSTASGSGSGSGSGGGYSSGSSNYGY